MSPDGSKMTNDFSGLQISRHHNQIHVEVREERFQIYNFELTKSQVSLILIIVKIILNLFWL